MTDRERAVALYSFLKEFSQLRTKTIRDISRYEKDGQIIWVTEIPREHGCDCIAWRRNDLNDSGVNTSGEVWLEIRRPRLRKPPEPPDLVRPWVRREQIEDSSIDLPELLPTIPSESTEDPPTSLDDHPEVQGVWDSYIEDYWWSWAEQDRRELVVQKVYTELFSIYQRQQRLGERFEVIFGIGFLSWNASDSHTVQRHLVAAQVSVDFDTASGTLTVSPAGEGARPSLEQDMLDPQHRPDPQELRSIEETLEKLGESVWVAGPLDGLLKSWVHSASAEGEYRPSLDRPEHPGLAPVVHLAPALILRRRTERSFIRAFQKIIEQLETGEPVPEGVPPFISGADDHDRGGGMHESESGAHPGEIYFPLPANDAQQLIVQRLRTNQGVLVQGPPGTGKSHTIVNLICHALACGQRVLVTSQAVRALKVLRQMICDRAPDVAPLSVVLLGDDREALLAMEDSVKRITDRQNTWNHRENEATIANLERDLDRKRRRQAKVLATLRAIREREVQHDARFGYRGTLARIAVKLRDEQEELSWIPDDTPEGLEPPLSAAEFTKLVSLGRNERVSHWEAAGRVSIDLDCLPAVEVFEQAVRVEREARVAYENDLPIRRRPEYNALEVMIERDRHDLIDGLRKFVSLIERIERRPLSWTETAIKQILGDFDRTWRQLLQDTSEAAKSMVESARMLDANPIRPKPPADLRKLRADANDLLDHLRANGGWGFWPFRAPVVKRAFYIRNLRIGGRPCRTVAALRDLLCRLDAELELQQLRERWAPHYDLAATAFTTLVPELEDLCEPIEDAFAALAMKEDLSAILCRTPRSPEPNWSDRASLDRLIETLAAVETTKRYEAARHQIDQTLKGLHEQRRCGRLDPVAEELLVAIEERTVRAYTRARQRAADNTELAALLNRKRELLERLTARAPKLASEIQATVADSVWDERAQNFERAWNWSRAHAWVAHLVEPGSEEQYRLELDNTKRSIASTLEQLAAEKAWTHCFHRMTENERQHLVAWSKAVRAIGRGYGKYAPLHRRNAREHLNESRSAIPAWVMPLHRVAETIEPGTELFDIAIIDEASQSGPEALLLAYLAKKLVVVGDDKQIHPTYAGVNFHDVNHLRERHIAELPHSDSYGVYHSFFDLAEIRYQGRIRLREHFRCMPEIIQFSNKLSYGSEPLIPLRQYGAGRLEPTVATRHVPDGYQKGKGARSVNPPEAEAIVEKIVQICGEPTYTEKTIGVISLVGNAQARVIETQLVRKLGPEEMESRQLACGDAYAFQGDERDVMFLSMVSAPQENHRIRAMTDAAAQRRFNVAASRARDQLYLFHTATLADLNPTCMRYQLLQYCLDPQVATADVAGLDVSELERLAFQVHRELGNQPDPFESWFELDVFLLIARRGYRVIPQFKVAGRRIDLVVQGMDGGLAVECDGEASHGADKYEKDAARQRDLERCGWTFWRVRESVFRLDPDEALKDLWETLKRHRIFPTAKEERHRRETRQTAESPSTHADRSDPRAAASTWTQIGVDAPADKRDPDQTLDQPHVKRRDVEATHPSPRSRLIRFNQAVKSLRRNRPSSAHSAAAPSRSDPENIDTVGELAPYTEWVSTGYVPDPRTAKKVQLAALLAEVVECEGPVVAIRAYRLINRESGRQRLTKPARRALNQACAVAVRNRVVIAKDPLDRVGQAQLVLRSPKSPKVVVRERGPRQLDELPPDEIATLLRLLGDVLGSTDAKILKRQALKELGWVRLTRNVNEFLDECIALM